MKFDIRLDRLEKFYCTRIVEEYKNASGNLPNLDEIEAEILQAGIKALGGFIDTKPDDINLLTHEERMKYDLSYAYKEKLRLLEELDAVKRKSKKTTAKKNPKTNIPLSKRKPTPPKNPDIVTEEVKHESRAKENPYKRNRFTDEYIMKWDPQNIDVYHQIYDEEDRKWEAQQNGNSSADNEE